MRYAISSGALAAEALLAGRDFAALARERFARRQRVSVVNRFLYEAGGAFGLSLFARLASRADFRSVLAGFYRPGAARLALAPLVTALWKNRGRCAHRLPDHWCRRRQREIREVVLGRIG
jgi:flavin-dependent dehydrogenase